MVGVAPGLACRSAWKRRAWLAAQTRRYIVGYAILILHSRQPRQKEAAMGGQCRTCIELRRLVRSVTKRFDDHLGDTGLRITQFIYSRRQLMQMRQALWRFNWPVLFARKGRRTARARRLP